MKDTVISASRKRKELRSLGICFLLAFLVNAGAILFYHTPFYELVTQLGFIVVITVVFYFLYTLIRVLFYLGRKLFARQ